MTRSPFTADPSSARKPQAESEWKYTEYQLPDLPYPYDAFEGFLSAEILEIHHDRHHRKYVEGLNETLAELAEERRRGEFAHVQALSRKLAFHGSGHVMHTLYWNSMSPNGGGQPSGELAHALELCFGSVDSFRQQFAAAARDAEASGWGVLAYEPLGHQLVVTATESHQQMVLQGSVPLLVCDVWEHAYYLQYRNDRAGYVKGFMDVIDWASVARRLQQCTR